MKNLKKILCLFCVFILTLSCLPQNVLAARSTGSFYVDFMKVGDADSMLLEQAGNFILVDTGGASTKNTVMNILDQRIDQNVGLQAIIITHYDSDHIGCLNDILEHIDYKVGHVYSRFYSLSELKKLKTYSSTRYANYVGFVNAIISIENGYRTKNLSTSDSAEDVYNYTLAYYGNGKGIWQSPSRSSNSIKLGSTTIQWKNVTRSYLNDVKDDSTIVGHINNDSLIFQAITSSGKKILFLADLGISGREELINYYGTQLSSDLLKIAHHGYTGSTSNDLLKKVSPSYSIITCATKDRASTLLSQYSGFGKLYYVGLEASAASTLTISSSGSISTGGLYLVK